MGDHAMRMDAGRSFASSKLQMTRKAPIGGIFATFAFAVIGIGTVGCGDGESTREPVNVMARGALVSVDKGDTTVGFARGTMRVTESTGAFQISKSPITKKQYRECEAAKICKAPKLDECSDPALAHASFNGDDDSAAICVGRENAERYCRWVGGRLPTLAEWLRAARGPSVQEHPWGSKRASCAQHPNSVEANPTVQRRVSQSLSIEGCEAQADLALVTQKHPAGAADSGMQDVLIAPSELLQGDSKSPFGACAKGQHCLVYGMNPGSIDSVKPYTLGTRYSANQNKTTQLQLTPHAYGFRCVVAQ
jgi:hypothetical protein